MKNNIEKIIILIAIIAINLVINTSFAQQGGGLFGRGPTVGGGNNPGIYNQDLGNVLYSSEINDPIEDGAKRITPENAGLAGTDDGEITDYMDALTKVLQVIQNIVNYALGILGTVALIYLIIHGFIILTAAGDDSKVKKGLKGVKNAFIAITGIGLSWIIIRFILRLISYVAP